MGSTLKKMQPALLHVPITKDIYYTPRWLSKAIVEHFAPSGQCLDPCIGDGAFYDFLPEESRDWCEIEKGRDFYSYKRKVDWCIGNPPYSNMLSWIRHSFTIADNIVYLIPLHRTFASLKFLKDIKIYGGVAEIYIIGTGTTANFPFGHALAAVHFKRDYTFTSKWVFMDKVQ